MLIFGTDICSDGVDVQCHGLTFDLALVTYSLKILPRLYLGNVRYRKLVLIRDIGWGCRCAASWCGLDLTLDFAVVTLNCKILLGQLLRKYKLY